MAERSFNTPAEKVPLKAAKAGGAARKARLAVPPNDLVGTWVACDQDTRGLVRVVLGTSGGTLTVHVFGACTPTPCDWGVVDGIAYAESVSSSADIAFSARYSFSFKETIVTGRLDSGSLIVETYNQFTDGSARSDYYSRGYFCKKRSVRKSV